ncbi:MAG TPA: tetratricopeptide repeat protein, partial [candidate division Zixibacteria bacterium]|nr:tetratricopeptide repeat protein [candidate division Zixibacteria bacterium]
YTLSLLTFFVCARYRQPMIPFLLLFAVFAIDRMITYVRRGQRGNTALWAVAFVLLALASNHDMLKINPHRRAAEDYQMFGNAYLDEGNLAAATMEFKKAVLADSTYGRPYNNLGLISTRRGNPTEAAKYFYKAITIDPNIVETYINYASTFFLQNDPQSAARVLEMARKRFPLNDTVMQKLAVAYTELGRRNDAIKAIKESLRLNPSNADAQQIYRQLIDTASGN